jgi:hypothetical protein
VFDQVPVVEVNVSPNVVVPLIVGTAEFTGVITAEVVMGEFT